MKQIKDTFFIVVGNMICSLGIGTIALRLLGAGENRQKVSSENRHFQSIKNNQS